MSEKKKSIYIGPPVAALLRPGDTLTPRLNQVAERYMLLIKSERVPLEEAEFMALCDVVNGTILDAVSIPYLEIDVEEGLRFGLSEKWGIDGQILVTKLKNATLLQKVALAEAVERFWSARGDGGE